MKTRQGFVSNSSSSSFVVLLPSKPKCPNSLRRMMFPRWNPSEKIEEMTIQDIVNRVFEDIERSERSENNNSLELFNKGHFDEIDDSDYSASSSLKNRITDLYKEMNDAVTELDNKCPIVDDYTIEHRNKIWSEKDPYLYKRYEKVELDISEFEKRYASKRKEEIKEFYEEWKNKYKYHRFEFSVEYSDRHGEVTLEHSSIFRNVPHLQISHH